MMIIIVFLIKFIFMLSIKMRQNINILLQHIKTVVLKDWKTQNILLNLQIKCSMSINTSKSKSILIVFENMIADMISNKKLNQRVTDLNTSTAFITQSYFALPKDVRLNCIHFFIMKIPNRQDFKKLQLIIHMILTYKDFIYLYKKMY